MENSINTHPTKVFNFTAAKVAVICSIVFAVIFICLRAQFLFVDDARIYNRILGTLIPISLHSIAVLLFVATFYYLSRFFKQIGYRSASICINLIIICSLVNYVIGLLTSYFMYKQFYYTSFFISRLLILVSQGTQVISYILDIVLAIIILARKTDRTTYRLVKPFGAWYLVYTIICVLLYILGSLFSDLLASGDVVELDAESEMLLMQYKGLLFSFIYFIPFLIAYIAILKMYNKYQKMIDLSEKNI